jgi:CO/xanthine dehydrogenase Mo-binding subunit
MVGQSILRKEGRDKLLGRSLYTDDYSFPGMIYGTTVRSQTPRGKLKEIKYGKGINWSEFTIITEKDLPGPNCVAHITNDQQCLAGTMINHADEAVLLLAHPDREALERAKHAIELVIDPLPPVLTIDESLAKKEIVWGSDNILKAISIDKGDINQAFSSADVVIESEYETGAQEHLYIEPNGVIATVTANEVKVLGSMQCPYYVHKSLVKLFGLPNEKVRVIQAETGGGFGGKEDYPSMLAAHAALLSQKSRKPVKMIYDRTEDMAATTKRHPSKTRIKAAASKDGKLQALDIDFVLDGGAYITMSPVVLSRGTIHAGGPYYCPNVKIRAKAVATNYPPYGAFRGFGAPQCFFALERHMDKLAAKLGIEPDEFRRRNFLLRGDTMATGQAIREDANLAEIMEKTLKAADYHAKKKRFTKENKTSHIKRGLGFSAFMHGAGFTGSGEKFLASVAAVEATRDGRVRVLASSTEMGQGARTIFSQISAKALGVTPELIDVTQPDTSVVPNSGPTVASRTTMVVGKLIETASTNLKDKLLQAGFLNKDYVENDFREACGKYIAEFGELKCFAEYKQPDFIKWDDNTYKGDAYGTFTWAIYVAEVSVDTRTYEARVENFVAAQEIGKVVNPTLAEGQIEGGVIQGIGYTLNEEVIWKQAKDVPLVKVLFMENPYPWGPSGAKGIGELPMDGVAPAVLNAIQNATGLSVDKIPLTPEKLMTAMKGGEK